MLFAGTVAVISGAANPRGICFATARLFASQKAAGLAGSVRDPGRGPCSRSKIFQASLIQISVALSTGVYAS